MQDFCHLLMHSRYSFLRGTMDVEAICRKAAHDGQRYAALADVNSLAGAVAFAQACATYGLRPVVGVDLRVGAGAGERRALLLARNARGYAALCETLTHLHLSDALSAPPPAGSLHARVRHPLEAMPFDLAACLRALPADVLVLTADEALLDALAPAAPERLFVLVPVLAGPTRHARLLDLAARLRRPAVAAHDIYFMTPGDHAVYQTLRAVALATTVAFLPEEEAGHAAHHWVGRQWMIDRFASPAPVYAIRQVLEQVDLRLGLEGSKPASFFALTGETPAAPPLRALAGRTWAAFSARYPDASADHAIEAGRRVEKELRIIDRLGFADYFLIAHDVVDYARRRGYPYLGRGSGASSFVAFLLGITQVNPLVLDLYFERFLNPARASPPDFDLDFSWRDRDDVLAYVFGRFGAANTALLSTHVTLRGRGVVRQVGRTLGLTEAALSAYTRRLPSHLFDDPEALQARHPEARGLDLEDPTLRHLLAAVRLLYGIPTHYGVHAGGVVLTSAPVTTYTALTRTPKGLPVTQLDMHGMEAWGVMKLDVLATRGLGTFADALALARQDDPAVEARVNDAAAVLSDVRVRATLRGAETIGLFYVESPGMRSLLRKLRIETFDALTAASSIIRPGVSSSGMMQAYVARHRAACGLDARPAPTAEPPADPLLAELLRESYGVMIYQEDVLKVAHAWAGLTLAEADLLRRAMSGASRSAAGMQALRDRFFAGCRERGRDEATARTVWQQIASFAGYAFCKSHSASYAKLSMQQAYLKAYHPAAFLAGVLRNGGGYYHPQVYVYEARRLGVDVLAPCVLESEAADVLVTRRGAHAVRLGLGRVRDLSEQTTRRLVAARRDGAFTSVPDFLARTAAAPAEAEALIDVGAFDVLDGDDAPPGAGRRYHMWALHLALHQRPGATLFPAPTPEKLLSGLPPRPPYTPREILQAELFLLGLPLTYHPMDFVAEAEPDPGTWTRSPEMTRQARRGRGRRVRMIGWLMAAKRITTRRRDRPMLFLTLYDGGPDLFEAVLFPDVYGRCAARLDGAGPYELRGVVEDDHGAPVLHVHDLRPYPHFHLDLRTPTPWTVDPEGMTTPLG